MRNLKRVLSLALATVMLLGMMVIGAGAADAKTETKVDTKMTYDMLSDKADIVNKEAVALMVDLGIIVGKPDGTYAPKEAVDRATMAKLIYFILMGTADESSFKGVSTPLTDVKGNWAEGFINYAYSVKIVAGVGDNKYNPSGKVTVASAAKMLLVSLGYDAKLSKYEGDAMWSVNIMRDAQKAGLLKGISQKSTEELTRDNAAQMIFNALFAQKVVPVIDRDQGVAYLTKYDSTGLKKLGEDSFDGLKKVEGVLTKNAANTADYKGSYVGTTDYPKLASNLEDLGKKVSLYTNGDGKKVFSSFVVASSKNKVVTVPAGLNATDDTVKTSVAKFLSSNNLKLSGKTEDYKYTDYATPSQSQLAKTDLVIANATVAYVVDNNEDGVIDALVTASKKFAKLTGDVKTKLDTDGKTTLVHVPGVTSNYGKVDGYKDLKKGDRVMWIAVGDTTTITPCKVLNGQVTGYKGTTNTNTGSIYIDKTAYSLSSIAPATFDTLDEYIALGYNKDAKFWLDENGNLLAGELVEKEAAKSKTAIVLGWATNTASSVTENNELGTAKLLFSDGTVELVKVASYDTYASKDSAHTAVDPITAANAFPTNKTLDTGFRLATYKVNDKGLYEMVEIQATGTSTLDKVDYTVATLADDNITPGKAVITDGGNASTQVALTNANTQFIVAKYDGKGKVSSYSVTTGFANAPKYVGTGDAVGANGYALVADGVASVVFVTAGTLETVGVNKDYVYVPAKAEGIYSGATKNTTWDNVYMNGEKVNIEVKNGVTGIAADGLFEIERDADGIVVKVAPKTFGNAGIEYKAGVISVNTQAGTPVYYTYADDVAVYVVDNGVVTAVDVTSIEKDATDTVVLLGSKVASDNRAQTIYIKKVSSDDNGFKIQLQLDGKNVTNAGTATVTKKTGITATVTSTDSCTSAKKASLVITPNAGATVTSVTAAQTAAGSLTFTVIVLAENNDSLTCTVTVTLSNFT